ncbi:MAG: hypothetical protein ACOX1P_00910 [Thermoguttaceae bacterium]|jgi:hypothetical protein
MDRESAKVRKREKGKQPMRVFVGRRLMILSNFAISPFRAFAIN